MAIDVVGAVMVTVVSAGGETVTITLAVTVTPPTVAEAVMVAVPPATAVTRPAALTLATPDADELHVTVAGIAAPFWSFGFAVS
jgi:hypothetical protein